MKKKLIAVTLAITLTALAAGPRKLPKPGWNLFSKEQDVQLGREAAAQVEKQYVVVQNKDLTDYINRVGQRLVKRGGLDEYPFYFKVVQDESINAFALPGGPMYVHTGLISAAENEGQLAGVLAHELSHVVLRHGTSQASKAQGLQLIAGLGGALAGGNGGLLGGLAQLGVGLGANSVLLKFSRKAESEADLLGVHTMAKAGYDPIEMAHFFEKIEAEANSGNSRFAEFFSDHPNPGNRVKMVEDEIPYLPKAQYGQNEGDINKMRQIVAGLPKVKKGAGRQGAAAQPQQGGSPQAAVAMPRVDVSSSMTAFQRNGITFGYPSNWQVIDQSQSGATIAPKEGVVASGGGNAIGYGILVNMAQPAAGRVDLTRDTQALIQQISQGNSGMQVASQPQSLTVGGSRALITKLNSTSPFQNTREVDMLLTIDRGSTLQYFVFIAPEPEFARLEPMFQQISRSIQFSR